MGGQVLPGEEIEGEEIVFPVGGDGWICIANMCVEGFVFVLWEVAYNIKIMWVFQNLVH